MLAASVTVAGDYLGKLWSLHQNAWIFAAAMVLYGMSGLFYLPTLLKEGLIVTSLIWTILTVTGFMLVGLLVFHEHLTILQWSGVGFGVIAITLLSL